MLQVLTVQGYITRAEFKDPDFVGLKPWIEEWSEARIRHAAATEPSRLREARARLIRLARRIERIKIEWTEGPQTPAARERLLATNHRSSHGQVVALSHARRKASSSPSR